MGQKDNMSSTLTLLLRDCVHEAPPVPNERGKKMIFKYVGNKQGLLYALSEKLVEADNARDNKLIAERELNQELELSVNN